MTAVAAPAPLVPRPPVAGSSAVTLYRLTADGWVGPAGRTFLAQVLASDLHDVDDPALTTAVRNSRISAHRQLYEILASVDPADRDKPDPPHGSFREVLDSIAGWQRQHGAPEVTDEEAAALAEQMLAEVRRDRPDTAVARRLLDELADIGIRLDATDVGERIAGQTGRRLGRQSVVNYLSEGRFALPVDYVAGNIAQWTPMQADHYVAVRPGSGRDNEQPGRESPRTGVAWNAAAERWRAGVRRRGARPVFLGLYVHEVEAVDAVDRFEETGGRSF
jgi:hypothetical protein